MSQTKQNFEPQAPKPEFGKMTEKILEFWKKNKIFHKSIDQRPKNRHYVFYDGPPFATGEPHYGHIVASVMKDVVPRYWTMRGYSIERKWGWDCHGLPIENIAEKELGITHKKEIEAMGVEKFNEYCRSKVLAYVDIWNKVIPRLGRWVDMKNSYRTMDLPFMESVWWVFKQLWDKGLVYESYRSMYICPRCETTLSQSEVAEGYKDVKDLSVVAKFELVDEPGIYILAWTTTPWTLIGNVALAVGSELDYSYWEILDNDKKEIVIIAKELESIVLSRHAGTPFNFKDLDTHTIISDKNYKRIKTIKGKELVGKKYKPIFDYYANDEKLENRENGWKVYAADFVTTEDGTGVVHIAPAFGEDDMNLGKQYNLLFIQHVGMDGVIKNEATDFAGLNVKPKEDVQATDVEIIKYLAKKNALFAKEQYLHSYPHCWRCDTPLINYATSSWFVKVTDVKEKMLDLAKNINWSPEYIKEGRFGNWLEGARDWSISRQRYWASVIPLWKCDCGEMKVVGSVAELEELSGQKVEDLHKHIVDKISFTCVKCGGAMKRIPDVIDTWFDSGSMPYAQMHYPFENKEKFEDNFPAEFIAEGVDQTRCWFYYLHVIASAVREKEAYKNVIVNGIVLAEDGKKMSKRLKNYPDPSLIFEKYGADAMRYYLLSSPVMLAENLNFSEKGVSDILRNVNMILWNVYNFYAMYADELKVENLKVESDNVLDKWILARLNQLIGEVTEGMDKYNLPKATRPISEFIDDLSTWYLRRSRDRFKGDDAKDKEAAIATTGFVLLQLSKVIAPFMPFLAEQLWQKVTGNNFQDENKSVHLESWSEHHRLTDKEIKIVEEMEKARKIVEVILADRDKEGIKVRQPLGLSSVGGSSWVVKDGKIVNLILDEVNLKNIEFTGEGENLTNRLSTELTMELKMEGVKRDLVRSINNLRKDAGMTIQDRAVIYWQADDEMIKEVFEKMKEEILKDTLSTNVEAIISSDADLQKEVKINDTKIILGIKKK